MKKILIIDDDEVFREMTRQMLERAGYSVAEAIDGFDGRRVVSKMSPDLVVTDLLMPKMDGIEMIRFLRENNPEIKIIAVSGYGQMASTTYLPTARVLGAHRSFGKPFENKEFLSVVKDLLAMDRAS